MLTTLDQAVIDWGDLDKAREQSRELLLALAADKAALGELVARARETDDLFDKCEHHRLLDKLVVYDALERGMRIRVHLSTSDHKDRPHDHRFSFTTLILRGRYRHVRHQLLAGTGEQVSNLSQDDFDAEDAGLHVEPRFVTTESTGSCYTLHHSEIHTTFTTPLTVSLFLRGPAEKERSIITDRQTGKAWWRYGEEQEKEPRRGAKRIGHDYFDELATKLRYLEVI
ncbi:MAG: hypothetical protein ACJ74U_07035 [Jatrophihabitantaceae bacterium]